MKKYLLIILLFTGAQKQGQVLISLLFGDMLNSDGLEFGLEGGLIGRWSAFANINYRFSL